MSELARYEEKAKTLSTVALRYSLDDVKATLALWKDEPMENPYVRKLYAEFDAYTVELYRRNK